MLKIPFVVSKAVHDVSTNGKYMQIARKYGLESTTFASEELIRIDRELSKVKSKMRIGDAFHRDLIVSNDINKELRRQVKTLKAENDELNAELVNTYDKNEDLRIDLKQAIKLRDKFGQERDDNKKNVDILKSELRTQKKGHLKSVQGRIDVIKELQVENDSLKDEAVKWNRKYNRLTDDYINVIDASYD